MYTRGSLSRLSRSDARIALRAFPSVVWCALLFAVPCNARELAYIANQGDASVSVLDIESGRVTSTIPVSPSPGRVSIGSSGHRVYVVNRTVGAVSVIDGRTNSVERTISFDAPWLPGAAAETADGSLLHVVGGPPGGAAQGVAIDTTSWKSVFEYNLAPGTRPRAMAVHPQSGYVYVAMDDRLGEFPPCATDTFCQDAVMIADPRPGGNVVNYVLGDEIGDLLLTPDGRKLYVVHHIVEEGLTHGVLTVLDIDSDELIPTAMVQVRLEPPPGKPGSDGRRGRTPLDLALDPGRGLLYVSHGFGDYIGIVDTDTLEVIDSIDVGEFVLGIDLTSDGGILMAVRSRSGTVAFINAESREVASSLEVGRVPASGGSFVRLAESEPVTPTVETPLPTRTMVPCAGDCDGDGTVMISELIILVRIALGEAALEDCPGADRDSDGNVRISELIQAVERALFGCAS